MSVSFCRMLEHMSASEQHSDDKAEEVVRAGLNLQPDFWEQFAQITGNADGLSALLDVPRHKISGWASKVFSVLDRIKENDDGEAANSKAQTIPTGID